MATSIIKNPMAWKLVGTATGSSHITMPTAYNEIMLVAQHGSNIMSAVHTRADITPAYQFGRLGANYGNGGNFGITIAFSTTDAYLYSFAGPTTDVTSQATFKLYYR